LYVLYSSDIVFYKTVTDESLRLGCKSILLFAKIAMAISFQLSGVSIKVSGVRNRQT